MSKQIKEGMKVRVSRKENEGWYHGIKFGAICTVDEVHHTTGEALVTGPLIDDSWNRQQFVDLRSLKLAKQANNKA